MNDARVLQFQIQAQNDKMNVLKNQTLDRCIYIQTPLSVPSVKVRLKRFYFFEHLETWQSIIESIIGL